MNALVPVTTPGRNVNVVQCAGDGIAADVRVFRVDARTAVYVVRIASTTFDLAARLVGVGARGENVELGGLSVSGGSIGSAHLPVTLTASPSYESVHLDIRSETAVMRVEAPKLPTRGARRFFPLAAALTVAMTSGTCAALFAFSSQQHAGAPVIVTRPVAVAPRSPRIVSLSVRRDMGPGTESILASYLAVADSGTLQLLDSGGNIVAQSPFTKIGTTRLRIPPRFRSSNLVARLAVRRGTEMAAASIALMPQAGAGPKATTLPLPAQLPLMTSQILTVPPNVAAGEPLQVSVSPGLRSAHIALQDSGGSAVAERDIPPGIARLTMPVPAIKAPQTYYVILRYLRNGAEETMLRTVVASPRGA